MQVTAGHGLTIWRDGHLHHITPVLRAEGLKAADELAPGKVLDRKTAGNAVPSRKLAAVRGEAKRISPAIGNAADEHSPARIYPARPSPVRAQCGQSQIWIGRR